MIQMLVMSANFMPTNNEPIQLLDSEIYLKSFPHDIALSRNRFHSFASSSSQIAQGFICIFSSHSIISNSYAKFWGVTHKRPLLPEIFVIHDFLLINLRLYDNITFSVNWICLGTQKNEKWATSISANLARCEFLIAFHIFCPRLVNIDLKSILNKFLADWKINERCHDRYQD